jgi:hypothetical protein
MNGSFDGWDMLGEETAEETQMHSDAPDAKDAPIVTEALKAE